MADPATRAALRAATSTGERLPWFAVGEALEQEVEVGLGELPLERGGELLVVILEGEQRCCCLGEAAEVVRGQDLALDDGEVDLVEPGCVDGQVDQAQGGPGALAPAGCGLAAVAAAVVGDPVHAPCRGVGLGGHDLGDEPPEWLEAGGGAAAADGPGAGAVPGPP